MSESEEVTSNVCGLLPSLMLHALDEMRACGELCDVTLCAGEGRFPAHRAVLAAASPFFRRAFSGSFGDSKQEQLTVQADEASLAALLHFVYRATLMPDCDAVPLLLLADFLQLSPLVCLCAEQLRRRLSPDNVLAVLDVAATLGLDELAREARNFVASQAGEAREQVVLVVGGRDVVGDSLRSAECLWRLRWRHTRPPRASGGEEQPSDTLDVLGQPRAEPAFAASSQHLYVVGGKQNAGLFLSSLERFSLSANRWQQRSPLPVRLTGAAATLASGQLWVIGGRTDQDWLDCVWIYNVETDRWHPGPRLPEKRTQHAALSWHNVVYVIGGKTERAVTASRSVLSLQNGAWRAVAPMQRPRANFACTLAHACAYVLGGADGLHTLADAERYDLAADTWQTVAPCSVPVEGARAATLGGAVLLVGGGAEGGASNRVERLGVGLAEWHCAPELCTPRTLFAIAVLDP